MVAPIIPCAPPRLDAPAEATASFLRRSRQFAALTALAGAPTVVLPLGPCASAGGAPVGLALFGQARSDQRLLAVACKLWPLAQVRGVSGLLWRLGCPCCASWKAAMHGVRPRADPTIVIVADAHQRTITPHQAELEKLQQQPKQQPAAAPAGAAALAAATSPTRKPKPGAARGRKPAGRRGADGAGAPVATAPEAPEPKKLERAEKAKARGNDLFRKGEFIEAVKAYTEALRHVPDSPVYYSNRAMAYLKAFRCGVAWGGLLGGVVCRHAGRTTLQNSLLTIRAPSLCSAPPPRFEQAESDCNRALGFDVSPADRVKALLRRGTARQHLYKVAEAAEDFRAALKLEPNNRQAREELRAIKQQEEEMASVQRATLMQQRAAAGDGPGGMPGGFGGLPHGMGGLGGGAPGMDGPGGAGEEPFLDADEYQRLLASGQVPVLLGEDGRPVYGPRGEPVIVAPDGQPMLIAPDGEVTPYTHR